LRALQLEGIEYEREIYERYFPDAVRIPERRKPEKRYELTVEAMHAGAPAILQGYLRSLDGVGVFDILELVPAEMHGETGNIYRVGEIKSSDVLRTSHVMQAAWYSELLRETLGRTWNEVFFILWNGERTYLNLDTIQTDYERAKADLMQIRESKTDPGPHLTTFCPSCHWRGLCMPELIAQNHISLVPGIGRKQAATFKESGITTWQELGTVQDNFLFGMGIADHDVELLRRAILCIEKDAPPLRQSLKPTIFQNSRVVSLEFPELAEQRKVGQRPIPSAIYYEDGFGRVRQATVSYSSGIPQANLSPILTGKKLAFYGTTDLAAFMRIARQLGFSKIEAIDVFSVVETFVHSPVPGTDLKSLNKYLTGSPEIDLNGSDRVRSIREVIKWINRSL
jgi:hypothetical protein